MSRPPGLPKTGGRKPGSPNKLQVTEAMRKDILNCYKRLGGAKWLLSWAAANEGEFVRQCLSRLMPAPPREEPSVVINNQLAIDADTLTDMQAASRIAFALAQAAQQLEPQGRVIDVAPAPEPVKPPPPPAPESAAEQREIVHFGHGAEQGVKRRSLL